MSSLSSPSTRFTALQEIKKSRLKKNNDIFAKCRFKHTFLRDQNYIFCMVSKSQIKLITSLAQKKYRYKNGLFVAEGFKTINELINSKFILNRLFTISADFGVDSSKVQKLDEKELKKISFLKTPQTALALFEIPEEEIVQEESLILALDGIRRSWKFGDYYKALRLVWDKKPCLF